MLFILPSLLMVLVVSGAYHLGRNLHRNLPVQASAARMPEGAAHEFA